MRSGTLRRLSPYVVSLSLGACGAGDHSAPALPTSPQDVPAKAAPPPSGIPMPLSSEGTKPAGFDAVFRVDPRPDTDGIIHGNSPQTVHFDSCGSRTEGAQPLTYLYDWNFDGIADVVGTGDACQKDHRFDVRNVPNARGNVLFEANVCVVSGNPRSHGPDTYFSCRTYKISLPVPNQSCTPLPAQFVLSNSLPSSASGSTVGGPEVFNPTCALSHAPDRTYQFTAPSTATYTFDTEGSGFDTMLAVLDECGNQIGCDDDGGSGLLSNLPIDLTAGQTVVVVVTGFNIASGSYTLNAN
jgi:hypothetical protein